LAKKEVWDGTLPWCNSQFFRRQSSWWSLYTRSSNRRNTSQYAKFAVWPTRTNSLWTNPLMSQKWLSCSRFCSSPVSPFSVWTSHPCTAHVFFPEL
jgi:hypothetical protein